MKFKRELFKKFAWYGIVTASVVTMYACNEKAKDEADTLSQAETQESLSVETRSEARSVQAEVVQHGKYKVKNLTQFKLSTLPELPELPPVPTPLHPAPSPKTEDFVNLPQGGKPFPPGYSVPPPPFGAYQCDQNSCRPIDQ